MMRAKGVELQPAENDYQESSTFGKRFGNGGGVTAAVLECLKEMDENTDIKVARCNGAAECKKALLLLKVGTASRGLCRGNGLCGRLRGRSQQAQDRDGGQESQGSADWPRRTSGMCWRI